MKKLILILITSTSLMSVFLNAQSNFPMCRMYTYVSLLKVDESKSDSISYLVIDETGEIKKTKTPEANKFILRDISNPENGNFIEIYYDKGELIFTEVTREKTIKLKIKK